MGIFDKNNVVFSKAKVEEYDYISKNDDALNEVNKKRMKISNDHSNKFAKYVASVITKEQFEILSDHHNYKDIRFGARRVARVINYARSILDYEVNHPEPSLDKAQFNWAEDIIIHAGFCHLLPGVFSLSSNDFNVKAEGITRAFIDAGSSNFSDNEKQLIVDAAIHPKTTKNGLHIVIDAMNDSMVIDDQYFDGVVNEGLLRCRSSKQVAFLTWSKKVSARNLSPNWLTYLQDIWEVDTLSAVNQDNISEYNRETERDDMI